MRIQGSTYVHGAQAINSPHRAYSSAGASRSGATGQVDHLDISSEAQYLSQVRDLPEIRADRVASIRAQIQSGVYETDEKINAALDRLLDEIG